MKYAIGNEKLGDNCLVVSRPVGLTCPSSCPFLHNGCYAEFTEKRFPNARVAAENNIVVSANDIKQVIAKALQTNRSIRIHERGDFLINNKVDNKYVNAWKTALNSFDALPAIWTYTHGYYKSISALKDYGVNIYASIHNEQDLIKAKKVGFELFAYCTNIKRKKGDNNRDVAKLIVLNDEKFVTCPEQRRGRKEVTCAGSKDTITCNLCVNGLANVAFLEH